MALYGVDFFGASKYGPRVFLDFDAGPMRARTRGYNEINVSWATPAGAWSILRVVRNAYGTPVSQDDGEILVDSNSGPSAVAPVDPPVNSVRDVNLTGGRFQYYAVWLYIPLLDEWARAANTTGLTLQDYGYTNRLWELTPTVYRSSTGALLDQDNETLKTWYKIPGLQLDHLRTEYETLRHVNDPLRVSGNLLPIMAQQWGQFFEPELGMAQMRKLLKSTVHLYRTKGTVPGVEAFVSAVSGFSAEVLPLKNLMLDYNDSSFEESIGRWAGTTNCSLNRYVPDDIINSPVEALDMRSAGLLRVVASAAGDAQADLTGVARDVGVPVAASTSYVFSAYARSATTVRNVALAIHWYTVDSTLISSTAFGTGTATALADWTRVSTTATSPATAAYALVSLLVIGAAAAGEAHYFDALQFEVGTVETEYTDARLIDINTRAPRVNLVTNPGFETDVSGWAPSGGTLVRDTITVRSGGGSALWSPTAASQTLSYDFTSEGLTTYTGSLYVRGTGTVRLDLRDTTVLASSATVTLTDDWQRVSVTASSVDTTTSLVLHAGGASTVYVDDVLVEKGAAVQRYFDGTTYAFQGDTLWEDTPNLSRSHYFPQRKSKNYRMNALLPSYTPMGSSFRLRYAMRTDLGSVIV